MYVIPLLNSNKVIYECGAFISFRCLIILKERREGARVGLRQFEK